MHENQDPVEASVVAEGGQTASTEVTVRSDGEARATRPRLRWKRWAAAAGVAALAAGALVVATALAATRKSAAHRSDDEEEMSPEAYAKFSVYLGEAKARDIADDVRTGWMAAAEADAWSEGVQKSYERSRHRRDIEPEEWQAFEDGWRPQGW